MGARAVYIKINIALPSQNASPACPSSPKSDPLCRRDLSLIFSLCHIQNFLRYLKLLRFYYLVRSLPVVCVITPTLGCAQCFVCCDPCNLLNCHVQNALQTFLLTKVYFPSDTSEFINTYVFV